MLRRTKIKSREYGLVLGQVFIEYLTGSKALHYGLWNNDLPLTIANLGKAQSVYTDLIINSIPDSVKTILDVGSGAGEIAARLTERSFKVECLSPSALLNDITRATLPGVEVHDCRFEDFKTERRYDMVLFAESFQYLNMCGAFSKCREVLKETGVIMILDKFKCEANGRSPIGGGHSYYEYEKALTENSLQLLANIDLTEQVAPNFDLLADIRNRLILPFSAKFDLIQASNNPVMLGTALHFLGKYFKRRLRKHQREDRDAKGFSEYNTYRLNILKFQPADASASL